MWVPGVQLGGQHSGVETADWGCSPGRAAFSHSRPWSVRSVAFVVAVVVAEMGASGGRWLG